MSGRQLLHNNHAAQFYWLKYNIRCFTTGILTLAHLLPHLTLRLRWPCCQYRLPHAENCISCSSFATPPPRCSSRPLAAARSTRVSALCLCSCSYMRRALLMMCRSLSGYAHQHDIKHSGGPDGLRSHLGKMRQGCMTCVELWTYVGRGAWTRSFLLAHFLVWDEA